MASRTAIALLTWTPRKEQVSFYQRFAGLQYDTYVVADNNDWHEHVENIGLIQIDPGLCVQRGFKHLNPVITERIKCPASAWEKALYYFSIISPHYDYVWLFEDDVFIPQHDLLSNIDSSYDQDLLCADQKVNWDGETWSWEWYKCIPSDILPPPWAKSMLCATRLSRKLLGRLAAFLYENRDFQPLDRDPQVKKYLFIEYLINTVAMREGLSIATPEQFSGVLWRHDWKIEELSTKSFYHPMKDVAQQEHCRALLNDTVDRS